MTFHISQALLIERTIVVSMTILLFGIVSIGGLWLWRRYAEQHIQAKAVPEQPPESMHYTVQISVPEREALQRVVRALERAPQ